MNNLKNKLLYAASKKLLQKNGVFENCHKGMSAYVIANGSSLKYYDMKKFNDKIIVSCNHLFFHKDYNDLNVKYYFIGHPFFFYPYWTNPYSRKRVRNVLGDLHREKIRNSPTVDYFINLSTYFGMRGKNVHYLHHFDMPFDGFLSCRLDSSFTSMKSGLAGMLGMAMYMGFSDLTLVGCDYLCTPQAQGHFYEFGKRPDVMDQDVPGEDFVRAASESVAMRIVVPNESYSSPVLPSITYENLTGDKPRYRENSEIVLAQDMKNLDRCCMHYQMFPENPLEGLNDGNQRDGVRL